MRAEVCVLNGSQRQSLRRNRALPSSMLAEVDCINSQSKRGSGGGYQQCFEPNYLRNPPVGPLSLEGNSTGETVHKSKDVSGPAAMGLRPEAVQGTVVP